jgi:hypothetical protein
MRAVVALALVLLVLPAAGSTASVRSVTTPGVVEALALDGREVAYADGLSARDCDRVRIWNLQTRRVTTLGRTTSCAQTSTGVGIADVALGGGRVLWLHYAGGNIREWRLFTATRTSPRPRLLRFVARDADAPAPIVLGDANGSRFGSFLPYAVDRDVTVLRPNGSRAFTWRAPGRVVALSALFGRIAVASEGGHVDVLDSGGSIVRSEDFATEVSAVKLSGNGVLVQRGRTLELRRPGVTRVFVVGARSTLTDTIGERALYAVSGQIRQVSLVDGSDRAIATGSHGAAELSTLAVASGRRVIVRPLSS